MKSKSVQRILLLASGFCTVLVVLLLPCCCPLSKAESTEKTEKSKSKAEIVIHAPDIAAQGQSIALHLVQTSPFPCSGYYAHEHEKAIATQKTASTFFKKLFRTFISPNAP